MKLQVLVSAVNQNVSELPEKMHIESDCLIINQCDRFAYEEFEWAGRTVRCYSMKERGVGLSRNTALMRADSEILLFSDEDIRFDAGYEQKVLEAFSANPDADVITFQFEVDPRRKTYDNTEKKRIRWYNYGRYPAYAIAARTESLHRAGVSFSLLFGGGAKYSSGEDNLFLHDCLKAGLHIYADPAKLGSEEYRDSTWFFGYTEKFFFDRGVLYAKLYGCMAEVFGLRFLLVKRQVMCQEISVKKAFELLRRGIREGRRIRTDR